MTTRSIAVIVAILVVLGAFAFAALATIRRRRLKQRFGPEYDTRDSRSKAESELKGREQRVRELHIASLEGPARTAYLEQWVHIQELFVDTPADAVAKAQLLVTEVMKERGFPTEHDDQVMADLSVDHSDTLDHYRSAILISESSAKGTASTEDLRQGMIHYRAMVRDLLGAAADETPTRADTANTPIVAGDAADSRQSIEELNR
jgi:hypothetical protein